MLKRQFYGVLISLFLLTACVTGARYQETIDSWRGVPARTLFSAWGYPDTSLKTPNGNTVYMYEETHAIPAKETMLQRVMRVDNTTMAYSATAPYVPENGYQRISRCRTWFEVNPRGAIVNARYEGEYCVAPKFSKTLRKP